MEVFRSDSNVHLRFEYRGTTYDHVLSKSSGMFFLKDCKIEPGPPGESIVFTVFDAPMPLIKVLKYVTDNGSLEKPMRCLIVR